MRGTQSAELSQDETDSQEMVSHKSGNKTLNFKFKISNLKSLPLISRLKQLPALFSQRQKAFGGGGEVDGGIDVLGLFGDLDLLTKFFHGGAGDFDGGR